MARKKKLTGIEVGQLFIKDLLTEWEAEITAMQQNEYNEDTDYSGLYTTEEREAMVAALKSKEDIMYYRVFKRIHDTIMSYPKRFCMFSAVVENLMWRMKYIMLKIEHAEETFSEYNRRPVIITQKEYDDYKQSGVIYDGGVAVLQNPLPKEWIDKEGNYKQPSLFEWECHNIEQYEKDFGEIIKNNLAEMSRYLSECFAMQEAVKIIAEVVAIPEVETTIFKFQDVDRPHHAALMLNDNMNFLFPTRFTPSHDIDAEATEAARNIARNLFKPIDIDAARPTAENVEKAREFIRSNISNIYTRTEAFHRIIRGK